MIGDLWLKRGLRAARSCRYELVSLFLVKCLGKSQIDMKYILSIAPVLVPSERSSRTRNLSQSRSRGTSCQATGAATVSDLLTLRFASPTMARSACGWAAGWFFWKEIEGDRSKQVDCTYVSKGEGQTLVYEEFEERSVRVPSVGSQRRALTLGGSRTQIRKIDAKCTRRVGHEPEGPCYQV